MAFDTFLKIEGPLVPGETQATGFKDHMEIYSFSWGASNPTTIGSGAKGMSGGKVSLSSFNVMKKSEKASAMLFARCCAGQSFDKATVTLRKAGGDGGQQKFLQYTFEPVFIESIQWSGSSGGDDVPTESVSISYGKVKLEYLEQDSKTGATKPAASATWDQQTVAK